MSFQIQFPSIAVVLHLSNLNLWTGYWKVLKQLPSSCTFFISTPFDKKDEVEKLVKKDIANAQIYTFENRGRDFGALISLMQLVPLNQFDLVLKLHTGNTEFYSNVPNERWLLELVSSLLPNGRLNSIVNFFKQNPTVGLAGPGENRWPLKKLFFHEGTASHWNKLTKSRKQSDFPKDPHFIAGGMFWARGNIFNGFSDLNLSPLDFEKDSPELDGTLAHTLERFISLIAHDQNSTIEGFYFNDFSKWLSRRTITASQQHQFEAFIANSQYQPSLQIIVKCLSNDDDGSLELSLKSIEEASTCGIKVNVKTLKETGSVELANYTNQLTLNANFDFLLFIQSGDELTSTGLLMAYVEMLKKPNGLAFYSDKMLRSSVGKIETAFLPDFNHDLLISFPWLMSNHWIFNRQCLEALGGFENSAGRHMELAYILKLLAAKGHSLINHISEPLIITAEPIQFNEDLEERLLVENFIIESGYTDAKVLQISPRIYKALYLPLKTILVSIIVPYQGIHLTQRCLESLLQNTEYSQFEIIIVDNHSKDELSINWLRGIGTIDPKRFRIVYNDGIQHVCAMNNSGARAAKGELLVFVDTCVEFIEPSWLDAMVLHGQRSNVGAVGVKLVDDNLNVLSAGYVIGMKSGKESVFAGERFDGIGYLQRLNVDQSYSAFSSQCLMVRSSIFESVGGFETNYRKRTESDIDFCLKIKNLGLDNIWTPHAVVQLGKEITQSISEELVEFQSSEQFIKAWLPSIANDSAYNKNLSLVDKPFSVEPLDEISWRPLSWRPHSVVLAHPSDETGCGQYRVIQPLVAMMQEGTADAVITHRSLIPSELERIQPDTVIFQMPLAREFLNYMEHAKIYSKAFKVYEIDDLITNIPLKSHSKSKYPKDTVKLLREGIACVDRLVVSTPQLAETYSSWHKDIQVLELKLPPAWWSNLNIMRTEHKKPRVGWAGGSSHLGDLELIADVVKDLADEVDWVFFGMCPKKLRPYIKEFHNGVPIHLYPQKLALLDLDLAIAPLENNPFNDCKSNLRLLEYGACAYPVICSDTRAFVDSKLPVQIVKNKFKEWTGAIRSHIYDLDACHAKGKELAAQVSTNWMLDASALNNWKATWTKT